MLSQRPLQTNRLTAKLSQLSIRPTPLHPRLPTPTPTPAPAPRTTNTAASSYYYPRTDVDAPWHFNRSGIIHIKSTKNNTICTLTNLYGQVVATRTAGSMGYKNSKKGTPFAAMKAGEAIAEIALQTGYVNVVVKIKGIGKGRESAVRALKGLTIVAIRDRTAIPHNGCRPPKMRRV